MGMLQGKTIDDTFIVIDIFELPVEGTETRVNAQAEAYEFMVDFDKTCKDVGRRENVVGWYHSHPGYGCWMSGIDVNTQMLNQRYGEPFVGIVIDPMRTCATGKVEIGAFRTYPEGYAAPEEPTSTSRHQTIPLSKVEDFGVHADQYYALEVSFFKSSLDARNLDELLDQYWVNTLTSSPLTNNRLLVAGQVGDIEGKIAAAEKGVKRGAAAVLASASSTSSFGVMGRSATTSGAPPTTTKDASPLRSATRDALGVAVEQTKSLAAHAIKAALFDAVRAVDSAADVVMRD
jgi:COP9 signalosome complex subunit 5